MSQRTIPLAEAARMLGIGPIKTYHALRARKVLDKNNLPYRKYVQQGLLSTELKSYQHPTLGQKLYATPNVTEKGMHWLAREFDVEITQASNNATQQRASNQ